jgi:hypothetical protein
MLDPLPLQCEGDARARELTGTSTIQDDLLRQYYFRIAILFKPARIDANRARNRHRSAGVMQAALQIHEQNVFANFQLVSQLFWCEAR